LCFLLETFYRIGALSFGGGYVVIPFIFTEFVNIYFDESDLLNGFAIVSLFPGPMFNISGFCGTLVNGIIAGLLSAFALMIPGILICFGSIKYLEDIKTSSKFQFFVRGAGSASLGFVFMSILKLWEDSCYVNPYSNVFVGTINVIICIILFYRFRCNVPVMLVLGGLINFISIFIINEIIIGRKINQ
jgi:chromate transporter